MGEVVFGYFRTKRNPEPEPDTDTMDSAIAVAMADVAVNIPVTRADPDMLREYDEWVTESDRRFTLTNVGFMVHAGSRAATIEALLFEVLEFDRNSSAVELERRDMRFVSIEDLAQQLVSTTHAHWRAQRPFFCALVLEFNARIERIRILCAMRG